jgi:microcystin-dependent protein
MAFTSRVNKGKALSEAELDNNFLCHYPIGSLYLSASPATDSPGGLIGYGRWSKFAKGRALISSTDIGNSSPNRRDYSPSMENGSPSVKLTEAQIPKHAHQFSNIPFASDPTEPQNGDRRFSGNYNGWNFLDGGDINVYRISDYFGNNGSVALSNSPVTHSRTSFQGSSTITQIRKTKKGDLGQAHNNIQPYVVINIWKRDS